MAKTVGWFLVFVFNSCHATMFYLFSSVSLCWWTGHHTHDPRITSITSKWGLSSCNVTDFRRNEWQPYQWMSSQNQHKWVQYLLFYIARDSKALNKTNIKLIIQIIFLSNNIYIIFKSFILLYCQGPKNQNLYLSKFFKETEPIQCVCVCFCVCVYVEREGERDRF